MTRRDASRGKLVEIENSRLNDGAEIQSLDQDEIYKYLGINENGGIDHRNIKVKTKKEYLRRLKLILVAQNKVKAINSFAVPVPHCTFGVVNWRLLEIKQLDRKTRKMLTNYKFHHPKANIKRLYIPRYIGELDGAYKKIILGLYDYIRHEPDKFTKLILGHEKSKAKYSLVKEGEKIREKYLSPEPGDNKHANKTRLNKAFLDEKCQLLIAKPLHGNSRLGTEYVLPPTGCF